MAGQSQIILHCGAKRIERAELATMEPPPRTATWVPVAHHAVLSRVEEMLDASGFAIEREQLGVGHNGHRFFGTLDLRSELAPGVNLSVGVRNSTDKSFPIGFCAGSRTFVCDNLSFSSDLIVNRKHTVNGATRFHEAITHAVQALGQFQETERRRIDYLRETPLTPLEAESYLLRAFESGILSTRTLPGAITAYREPAVDWGSPDRLWHLFNAMNTPMQGRAESNPQAFALTTMRLVALLAPPKVLGFDDVIEAATALQPVAIDERPFMDEDRAWDEYDQYNADHPEID
jgi:hypothetical protein